MTLPFQETKLSDNEFIREFSQDTDSGEFNDRFELIFSNSISAVEDIKSKHFVKVYPNPVVSDKINIQLNDDSQDVNVIVTDIIGRVVTNGVFKGTNLIKLNKPSNSGQYFIKVQTPKSTVTKTIYVK